MSEGTKLNPRLLLELGLSRADVAALQNMQRITGATIVDATELAEVVGIVIALNSELRSSVSRLQNEIELLKVPQVQRHPIKTAEIEELQQQIPRRIPTRNSDIEELQLQINRRCQVQQPEETAPQRTVNLTALQQQIDEIKTYLGM